MFSDLIFCILNKTAATAAAISILVGTQILCGQGIQTGKFEYLSNGNFELGNTGFYTDYDYSPNSIFDYGVYTVSDNTYKVHSYMNSCYDHTSGSGLMLIVNGHVYANQIVWKQTASVEPNTEYLFEFWFNPIMFFTTSVLRITINGVDFPTMSVTTPGDSCTWYRYQTKWFSAAANSVTINIFDLTEEARGNDFALDDFSLRQVCQLSASSTPDIAMCRGQSVQIGANVLSGYPPYTYKWFPAYGLNRDDIAFPTTSADSSTMYYVTITDSIGCVTVDSIMVEVDELPGFEITTDKPVEICPCDSVTLSVPFEDGFEYYWSTGEETPAITVRNAGIYKITIKSPANCIINREIEIKHINVTGEIKPNGFKASVGDTVEIQIVVSSANNIDLCNLNNFNATLKTNKSMLYSIDENEAIEYDDNEQYITFRGSRSGDRLALLRFIALLGNSECSSLELVKFEWECPEIMFTTASNEFCIDNICRKPEPRLFKDSGKAILMQNKPNPAKDITTIEFSVIEKGLVRLYVTNTFGEVCMTLLEQQMQPGDYSAVLDTKHLSSGAYYYILQTPTIKLAEKMYIIR